MAPAKDQVNAPTEMGWNSGWKRMGVWRKGCGPDVVTPSSDEGGRSHALVCLPPAGASSAYFAGWRELAGQQLDIVTPELPGRLARFGEAPLTRIRDMADFVLADLEGRGLPERFSVFGHSMGALVAFELVRLIEARDRSRPACLHVSAHAAPSTPRRPMPRLDSDVAVIRHFGRLNGRPAPPDLVELMLPVIRADLTACADYADPGAVRLLTPILAHGGTLDPHVGAAQLAGWRRHTRGGFATRLHAGDHHFPLVRAADVIGEIGRDVPQR